MKVSFLIQFLLINLLLIHLKLISSSNDCQICDLNGYFLPSNGYNCFLFENQTRCTCPDQQFTINRPCRICERENICGSSNTLCSEQGTLFEQTNQTSFYACFCSSNLFFIQQSCPIISSTLSTTTTSTSTSTETTTTKSISISTSPLTDVKDHSNVHKASIGMIIFLLYLIIQI